MFIYHLLNIYCWNIILGKKDIFCPHSYFSMGDMQVPPTDKCIPTALHSSKAIGLGRKFDADYLLSVDHT